MSLTLHVEHTRIVIAVPDGDGLEVYDHPGTLRIRLRHVDAPENGQPYARESRDFLRSLCLGKVLKFTIAKWDCYGRAVTDVRLEDGRNPSTALVAAGLAWWYRKYSRNDFIGDLEKFARKNKRGLWKDPNPTPPWEYRKARKLRSQK